MGYDRVLALVLLAALGVAACSGGGDSPADVTSEPPAEAAAEGDHQTADRTVRATVQMRPGGPVEEVEMGVHEAPLEPPTVAASEAGLADDDLVIGLVIDGTPIAYPIRYLATTEVMNDRVGDTALSPTW